MVKVASFESVTERSARVRRSTTSHEAETTLFVRFRVISWDRSYLAEDSPTRLEHVFGRGLEHFRVCLLSMNSRHRGANPKLKIATRSVHHSLLLPFYFLLSS